MIAYDLGISPRTVEIYRANVMTKMQAASLSELVRMAIVGGILGEAAKPAAEAAERPQAESAIKPRVEGCHAYRASSGIPLRDDI